MELPVVNLKVILLVHWLLTTWPLCLGQLHRPGPGRVGRGSAGLCGCHQHVPGGLAGHHPPGHHLHQHLLPVHYHLGHEPLRGWHGYPQPAAQAPLLLPGLPHVPGAWRRPPVSRFPRTFSGTQRLPDHRLLRATCRSLCSPRGQRSSPPGVLKPAPCTSLATLFSWCPGHPRVRSLPCVSPVHLRGCWNQVP